MNELLPQLLAFPPHPPPPQPLSDADYDRQIKSVVQLLNQTPASRLTGGDLLDILDPSVTSLPYLYTLLAHISSQGGKQPSQASSPALDPSGPLWPKMLDFVQRFDPIQVRYAGHEFRRLVEAIARAALATSQLLVAIEPIKTAMLRLDPSTTCFTSTHLLFAHMCLQTRAYTLALPILGNDIFHFPRHTDKTYQPLMCSRHATSATFITAASGISDKLNYRDHLLYFLYGAMIYMVVKDWERALHFLEIVITAPVASGASMIQVEAFKKWILAGLLSKGRSLPIPKHTQQQVQRHFRALAKPYIEFAKVFESGNPATVRAEFAAGQQVWQDDLNMGLMTQVLNAFRRFSVLKLEKTYAALPVSQIAERTSPISSDLHETENYLASLISSGQLNAVLVPSSASGKGTILRFSPPTSGPPTRSETEQYEELQKEQRKIAELAEQVKATDWKLELSKEYIEWAKRAKRAKDGAGPGADQNTSMMGMGDEDFAADEDMMADM